MLYWLKKKRSKLQFECLLLFLKTYSGNKPEEIRFIHFNLS